MARIVAIFTAFCMVVITGSLGAVLYLYFGLSGAESALVSLTALTGLALYNTVAGRLRDRSDVGTQIADLSRVSGDLARQVAEIKRQLGAAEAKVDTAVNRARAATDPLASEIGELGMLVKQLAETVAAHDAALGGRRATAPAAAAPSTPALPPADGADLVPAAPRAEPAPSPVAEAKSDAAGGNFKGLDRDGIVGLIREAVEANRIDLYLQPIVTLPQRKVRYYEAMSRLRTEAGEQVLAADFLPYAEGAGLMPKIDNLLLFRCVQVLRRLLMKNRDVGLFCNVSGATLSDPEFFPQFTEFMEANRALAPSLVFEFTQSAFRAMGPMEYESLAALSERGFRFSMDHVADLRMEPKDLSERGFRYLKVPAALLLNRSAAGTGDIHTADLSDLLARSSIDLIAERIESESSVVDLLDYDVKFGQGFLFSHPRPVRAEALQGNPGAADVVGRDNAGEKKAAEKKPAEQQPPQHVDAVA
jgi:cyclic-di-GMP phosphodiesterase TipF (flagellum assembly factor)